MEKQAFVAWVKVQRYSGKRFKEGEAAQVECLYRSLSRFCTYLRASGERTNRMVSFSSFVRQASKLDDVIIG